MMDWTISTVKLCARHELKKSYWLSLGVILVGNIISSAYIIFYYVIPFGTIPFNLISSSAYNRYSVISLVSGVSIAMIIYWAIAALYGIFVSSPISVGRASFFINAPRGQRNFENLFSAFKGGRYMKSVKAMFVRDIRLFLWSLLRIGPSLLLSVYINYSYVDESIIPISLLIVLLSYAAYVPYYIKYFQWYLVPYIVADNPDIDPKDALELSTQMTNGHKGRMFWLSLSFIGWYILGCFACCIGIVFVVPYQEATFAHLYFARKGEVPVDTSSPYPPYPQYQYLPQYNGFGYNYNAPQPNANQDPPTDTVSD